MKCGQTTHIDKRSNITNIENRTLAGGHLVDRSWNKSSHFNVPIGQNFEDSSLNLMDEPFGQIAEPLVSLISCAMPFCKEMVLIKPGPYAV
jgi:hypothetical protein